MMTLDTKPVRLLNIEKRLAICEAVLAGMMSVEEAGRLQGEILESEVREGLAAIDEEVKRIEREAGR
jgi:hypothetical protein